MTHILNWITLITSHNDIYDAFAQYAHTAVVDFVVDISVASVFENFSLEKKTFFLANRIDECVSCYRAIGLDYYQYMA